MLDKKKEQSVNKGSETKDHMKMSCLHDSINHQVNGKLGPIERSLSITEIKLPPY